MNTYYIITAKFEGETEELFGSFDKNDCLYELEAEKESWKGDGYKSIKITSKKVKEEADTEVYPEIATQKDIKKELDTYFNINDEEIVLIDPEMYDWNFLDLEGYYEDFNSGDLDETNLVYLKKRVEALKAYVKSKKELEKYTHIYA